MKITKVTLVIVTLLSLGACSKDDDEGINEGLRLTVDAQEINFTDFTEAEQEVTDGIYNVTVRGTDAPTSPRTVRFGISSEQPIVAGKYEHDLNHDDYVVTLDFLPDDDYMNPYQGGLDSDNPMSITITSITDVKIQGTFEGTVNRGADTKVITKGSFNLPLK